MAFLITSWRGESCGQHDTLRVASDEEGRKTHLESLLDGHLALGCLNLLGLNLSDLYLLNLHGCVKVYGAHIASAGGGPSAVRPGPFEGGQGRELDVPVLVRAKGTEKQCSNRSLTLKSSDEARRECKDWGETPGATTDAPNKVTLSSPPALSLLSCASQSSVCQLRPLTTNRITVSPSQPSQRVNAHSPREQWID
jgi:hypothetical protein